MAKKTESEVRKTQRPATGSMANVDHTKVEDEARAHGVTLPGPARPGDGNSEGGR